MPLFLSIIHNDLYKTVIAENVLVYAVNKFKEGLPSGSLCR